MNRNWRKRCDWCGWPLDPTGSGCVDEDHGCSMRPMPELDEVGELRQHIRRLERACSAALVPLTGGDEFMSAADAVAVINDALDRGGGS